MYGTSSPLFKEMLACGFARMNTGNTGLVLPDGTPLALAPLPGALARILVNNNAATPYAVPASTRYVGFTGTNLATLAIAFPAAAAALDGFEMTVYTAAAVGTAVTFTSTGATFVGAPATLAAGSVTKFVYNHATTQWFRT